MAVREYIGARYVPIFGRKGEESIEWDNSEPYEPLTIVLYQGVSYTSRQYVPAGIEITNSEFWAETGNYNGQVEAYRQEVRAFDARITANADGVLENSADIAAEVADRITAVTDEANTRAEADNSLDARITANQTAIAENSTAISQNKTEFDNSQKHGLIIIGDSYAAGSTSGEWVATWPNDIKNALNCDLENLAIAGTGWVQDRNGSTFLTECQTARDNATFADYGKVDIIVYGGINDINAGASTSAVAQNMRNGIRALRATYPNAHIYIGGINLSNQAISRYLWPDYYQAWQSETYIASGNVTFHDARGWLCSDNISYAADNLHPNGDHGNDLLKVKWLSILQGNESHYTVIVDAANTTDGTSSNDWMLNALKHCKLSCCEGRYKLIPYRYTDFTTFNAVTGYTAADVGKQYQKGNVEFTGVYRFPDPRSTNDRNNTRRIDMTLVSRAIEMPFRPYLLGSGDIYYVWWEVTRPAPTEAQTMPSNAYAQFNGEWSVFGD